jgi:hypothetical protein
MMEQIEEKKTRLRHAENVTLKQEILEKVNGWLHQLTDRYKGMKVSRPELVNWMLGECPQQLSEEHMRDISGKFFNDVDFMKWAIRELKESEAKGLKISLDQIMANREAGKKRRKERIPRKKRISNDQLVEQNQIS